ncbi:stage III sporulation protein AE [Caminicella sporogenes]|uniref:stage III sporulation protein AE n=1 Tax=Caminicella sporogenes TaxID=166485 RepID=UPI002540A20F|nr:stage III sporulation protein AE [Caminicella sporogenes]WIF94534.1 stage III sporulation protein AE [Caminicella sporogenes]
MKKSILILLILAILVLKFKVVYCYEGEADLNNLTDKVILEQIKALDISEIEGLIENMSKNEEIKIPNINIKSMIISMLKGNTRYQLNEIIKNIIKLLFKEIVINSRLLAQLIFISILCALLKNLSNSFGGSISGEIAFYGCYLIIMGLAVKSFMVAMHVGQVAIDNMVSFMQALIPVLLTLLVAAGSLTTSAIFKPIIVASIGITSTTMKDVVIPLVLFTAILSIINNFTSKVQISKLSSLIKQGCIALIGLILTVFLGIMSIQGVVTSTSDGIAMRTAKFAVDSFIPIVGGFMSEAVDTVLGCSLLLKNAVGTVGLILLLIIVSYPIFKIVSIMIIYKIAAALVEPISDSKIVNCLNDMSSAVIVLFATVISVTIIFFIGVTAIIGAANITAMIR